MLNNEYLKPRRWKFPKVLEQKQSILEKDAKLASMVNPTPHCSDRNDHRIRHVKCDETRPFCLRCQNFGIKCDGFGPSFEKISHFSARRLFAAPKAPPPFLLFDDDTEGLYFNYFRDETSFNFFPYVDPHSWRRLILQASSTPSIRHGLAALGALDRVSGALDAQARDIHHQRAIEQYNKAIRAMREDSAKGQNLRSTLVTCLVIIWFEAFHGNQSLADAQTLIGVTLIMDWMKSHPRGFMHSFGHTSPAPDIIEDELVQIFGRLDLQLMTYIDTRPIAIHQEQKDTARIVLQRMPDGFNSIADARIYLHLIIRRLKHFLYSLNSLLIGQFIPEKESFDNDGLSWVHTDRASFLVEMSSWERAFDRLTERSKGTTVSDLYALSRCQYLCFRIHLTNCLSLDETVHDAFLSEMIEIVELSERVLKNSRSKSKTLTYSVDIGTVPTLFYIGMKCRASAVRGRAIDLLLQYPRREGTWDSLLCGKMANWVREIEEEYMEDGQIPPWARVRHPKPTFDLENRRTALVCDQGWMSEEEHIINTKRFITVTW